MSDVKLAILLFSSKENSDESQFFLKINNIPKLIDIFDFSYSKQVSYEELIHEPRTDLDNKYFKVRTPFKATSNAIQYLFSIGYDYILYSHHDVFNLTPNAYSRIFELCNTGLLKNFGLIGFNIFHDKEIQDWDPKKLKLATTSRTFLQPGNGYYNSSPISIVNYKKFPKSYAFAIEIPMWACCLISSKTFNKINHQPISDFFLSLDDLALDYLKNNIYNICIPWISFAHQQSTSIIFGKPYKSPFSKEQIPKIKLANSNWYKKWKFPISSLYSIDYSHIKIINHLLLFFREFIRVKLPLKYQHNSIINFIDDKYPKKIKKKVLHGLLYDFYKFTPVNGPLKIFEDIYDDEKI